MNKPNVPSVPEIEAVISYYTDKQLDELSFIVWVERCERAMKQNKGVGNG